MLVSPVSLVRGAAAACLALVHLTAQAGPPPDPVLQWNEAALAAIRATNSPPPRASRQLAILHAAVFDAANGVQTRYECYLVPPAAPQPSSCLAAVATAGHDVLAELFPGQSAGFAVLRDDMLARVHNRAALGNGSTWGALVAQQVLLARTNDGSTAVASHPGSLAPGAWRPTVSFGGNVLPALLPQWGHVTPFGIADVTALQPPAPPALSTAQYALEVGLTQAIGGAQSSARSAEETEIAHFWGYGPGTSTPPGHWNQIAQAVVAQRPMQVVDSARLFALLNIALADAAIVCWRCKYDASYWRPITAIHLADQDGNAATTADPAWMPLLPTPPFPEYTSGHSTFSGAAAAVLAGVIGDRTPFAAISDDLPGVVRHYRSFSHAAFESGMSRIYGGIHFMSGNLLGLEGGARIGTEVLQTRLRRH